MASKFEVFSEKFDRALQVEVNAFVSAYESWDLSWLDGGWNNT